MSWYINNNGQPAGPYTDAQIIEAIRSGQITEAAICADGGEQWIQLRDYPPFAALLPPPAVPVMKRKVSAVGPFIAALVVGLVGLAIGGPMFGVTCGVFTFVILMFVRIVSG